ncbi:MAG TPA: ferritin family protein [Thermoflexia bacterium]|jgi:rubrerythrin|nr:ferritin family protein [Thermoflexia bacterium]
MAVFTAAEALDMALKIERNGETFYEAAARKVKDEEIRAVLEDLALQERRHYKAFQKLADRVGAPPTLSAPEWEEYDEYVQTALENALFAGPDKALAAANQVQTAEEALRMALGFEKDTLIFFYDLREMMPETEQNVVTEIIREEKAHVRRLARLLSKRT